MKSTAKKILRILATRGMIAVLPVAMVGAYVGGNFVPAHRQLSLDYVQVAEITVASNTVGIADSHLYGMSQADIDRQLDELLALGVQDIRVLVPWGLIETQDDTYNWSLMDRVMNAAAARNMGVMADINATPFWASQNGTFPGASAPPPAKFAEFVQQVALKYGNTVSAYEIWNEPNAFFFYDPISPETYADLLKAAYPVIKQIDPTATVVAGALGSGITVGTATLNPVDFVGRMYAAGAQGFFDALSFHPYQESLPFSQGGPIPNSPVNQLTAIKALMAGAGDGSKLVWITEYGLPTSNVTEQQQADYISNLLNSWQTFGNAGPVFVYTTRDNLTGSTNPEDNYGIFRSDWTRKLAAEAIRQFIAGQTQNPPPNPLEQFAQQVAQALAQLYALQVAAFFQAIANAWAGMFSPPPAPAASPLALRVASVEAPEASGLAAESVATTADVAVASGEKPVAAVEAGTTPEAVKATEVPATTPEVTVPEVVKVPEVTVPEVTVPEVVKVPEVTTPATSTPAATTPAATAPAATAPAATTPSADAGTTGTSPGTSTGPSNPTGPSKTADDTKKGTKHDDAAKSGASDKSAEKPVKSVRPAKVKGDKGSSVSDVKSKVGAEGITAGAAAESAPSASAAAG